jgi:hypothetical protein
MNAPAKRVAVRHPRTIAAQRGARTAQPALRDLDEQSAVGEVLVRSLQRAQLRLAAGVLTAFVAVFGGLALVLVHSDGFNGRSLFGVPLTWLLLGPPSYLVIVALGALYNRLARRNEREFLHLVERK